MKSWSKLFLLMLAAAMLAAVPAQADWQTATVGLGNWPYSGAVDPVRSRIFTANYTSGTVTVIDERTHQTQNWSTGTGSGPKQIVVNPLNGKAYVTLGGFNPDSLAVFDTLGNEITRLPLKMNPYSMVMDLDSGKVFVANFDSDTITVVRNDAVVASIAVSDAPTFMALNPVSRTLYLAYNNSSYITCINCDNYTKTEVKAGAGTYRAYSVAVNASVNKAYVTCINEDSLAVIDGTSNTVTAKILVGDGPTTVVCDPSAQRVYVANNAAGTVTAINCVTNTSVGPALATTGVSLMAINPASGKLYVGSANLSPKLIVLDWRSIVVRDSVMLSHNFYNLVLNPATNIIYAGMEAGATDSLAIIDGSDYDTSIVAAKSNTYDVAVNPITGDAYATNSGSDNVTVIKANGDTMTIAVGDNPQGLAVNPLTNKLFVANTGSKSVTVIDGASYSVERTITVDTLPTVIAVNPLTNYIYVNSFITSSSRIKVIDGKDWDTTSILVGSKPFSIAVNPATNRIYVGNDGGNSVTVIDGAHNTPITTLSSITRPYKIEANPVTNKIYVAGLATAGKVTVIDGATNATTLINVGNWPNGVAVNRANNKIYVSNYNDNNVMVIDGASNTVTDTIPVGTHPWGMGADPVTGKVFACNNGSSNISVIDCASGSAKTIAAAAGPQFLAVNPASGKVYAACNSASGKVAVIDQTVEQDTKVITYDGGTTWKNVFPGSNQNRYVTTINHWSPYKTNISKGFFSLATSQSFWKFESYLVSSTDSSRTWATGNGWGADTAIYGDNVYRRCALESQAISTNNIGVGTPFIGNITTDVMYRLDNATPTIAWWDSLADDNDSLDGYGPYTVKAVITDFSGLDTVYLHYNPAKAYTGMTRALADTFVGVIPAQTVAFGDTAALSYMIEAQDHAQNPYGTFNYSATSQRVVHFRNLTGVAGNPAETGLPKTFALQAAYPNPSRGQAFIKYQLPKASNVQLQVYNVAGQLVKTISEGQKPAGYHQITWKDSKLSNGIYFYQLKAGEFSATRKLVVLK